MCYIYTKMKKLKKLFDLAFLYISVIFLHNNKLILVSMVFYNVPQVKNNSRFIYCKH